MRRDKGFFAWGDCRNFSISESIRDMENWFWKSILANPGKYFQNSGGEKNVQGHHYGTYLLMLIKMKMIIPNWPWEDGHDGQRWWSWDDGHEYYGHEMNFRVNSREVKNRSKPKRDKHSRIRDEHSKLRVTLWSN